MMSTSINNPVRREDAPYQSRDLLKLSVWLGLLFGLVEGAAYPILQYIGWLTWNVKSQGFDQNILWASPMMDVSVFLVLGLLLAAGFHWIRPKQWMFWAVAVLGSTGCYTLLTMSGRMRLRGTVILALGLGTVLARLLARNSAIWMNRIRKSLIAVVLIVVVVGCVAGSGNWLYEKYSLSRSPAPPAGAPNVLLIVMDTMRMDRLSAYGIRQNTTPFLDSLAGKSVLFEKAFANAPWTLPSHVTFFTGKMPFEHGATNDPYDGRFPTIAQAMAARGYATVGVAANSSMPTRSFGVARGFQHYENVFTGLGDSAVRTALGRDFEKMVLERYVKGYRSDSHMDAPEVKQRFLSWLDHRPNRPFFAFLNYMETHLPNQAPAEFSHKFRKLPLNEDFEGFVRQDPFRARDLEAWKEEYDALAAFLDSELKSLFDGIQQRGLDKNLLVIIIADHGESIGEHQLVGHRISLYPEEIRVPMMIRLPGTTPEGMRIADPVSLYRIPATILALSGGDAKSFDGASLSECWQGGSCREEFILDEVSKAKSPTADKHWPTRQGWVKSLIAGQWHFIVQQDGHMELYDWHSDPEEIKNLANAPEGAEIVKSLTAKLEAWVPETKQRAKSGLESEGIARKLP
jgi:arylsulfatase A-like enzyme